MLGTPPAFVLSQDQTLTFKSWLLLTSLLTSYCCCLLKNYFVVNKFENLFLPLVFFTVQFSKSCPTPFGRFRSLKSACLVYQPFPFPSSIFYAFSLIFFLTFPLGSNIPPFGFALPSADFANYTHLSPFVNDFLPFFRFFFPLFRVFLPTRCFACTTRHGLFVITLHMRAILMPIFLLFAAQLSKQIYIFTKLSGASHVCASE